MEAINEIQKYIAGLDIPAALNVLANRFKNKVIFSTSFGREDQVITHIIFSNNIPIKIVTLDTGRLFPETYSVWNRTLEIYKKKIEVCFPDTDKTEKLLKEKGPFSFYESVENRKECCFIRKVEPLNRILKGNKIWITGIRKGQSADRSNMQNMEWDESHRVIKYHPLLDWTGGRVSDFIAKHTIPYNSLHDRGFPSIGCQPCTRAVKEGEDERGGRWWWENNSKKECGLHANPA